MNLKAYLTRIDYHGSLQPTFETLRALHRSHLYAIPYENLDIHLGRKLTLDPDHIYHKIVEERRGGWCYEMNGLFSQALRQMGFDVTLLGSSVGSPAQGGVDGDLDHLILLVQVDKQPWLADVGFGKGLLDPIPLQVGEIQQNYLHYRLEQEGENWYFHNQPEGGPGFGFTLLPRTYAGFASCCHELQTSPDSGFVRTTVCHRFTADGLVSLRGAILKRVAARGVEEEEIQTLERYRSVINTVFGLDATLADQLWDGVEERHRKWKEQAT